ncbi:MAG: CoA transferase [Planctomycetales bacterium]
MSEQVFSGIDVVDFTHVLSGPFCTYQLALLGAQVTKIEDPIVGDYMRRRGSDPKLRDALMGDHFLSLNSNKRSIAIDLGKAEGRDVANRLMAKADVVVENFRTGALDALGLGYAAIKESNPGLVYCALSGFGAQGKDAGRKAYDQVVQATSGMASGTGEPGETPVKNGSPVLDYASGMMASFAIASALFQRARDGEGRYIDVSMHDTALLLMSTGVMNQLHGNTPPVPHGNRHPLAAASGYFCQDREIIMLGCCTQGQFEVLCDLIGRPDLAKDPRFRDVNFQDLHRDILEVELENEMAKRTAAEWETLLSPHVPAARVAGLEEGIALARRNNRSVLQTIDLPDHDIHNLEVPTASFQFDKGGPKVTSPPPVLGQDTNTVLHDAGYSADEITGMLSCGAVAGGKA